MRVNTLILAGFAAVAVPGLLASGWVAGTAVRQWQHASTAEEAARVVGAVQRGQTAFALESGVITTALLSPKPDVAAVQAAAARTDRLFGAARRTTLEAGFDPGPMEAGLSVVGELRARLLATLPKPVPERDGALAHDLVEARMKTGADLAALGAVAADRVAKEAPSLATIIDLATQVMDLRDFAGRRNLMMNSWVAKQAVPLDQFLLAERLSGRVEQAWQAAMRDAHALAEAPAIQAEAAGQETTFLGGSAQRWAQVMDWAQARALGKSQPDWPETLVAFRGWSVPALASVLRLRDVALDAAVAKGAALRRTAALQAGGAFAMLLVAFCVAGVSMTILLRRVVLPVRALTLAVGRIAEGALQVVVPGRGRDDELGRMAEAIETLRLASIERVDLAARELAGQQGKAEQAARVTELVRGFEAEASEMLQAVGAAAETLDATAALLSETARDSSARAVSVAASSEQASVNVQTVAASTEQLTASFAEVSRQVGEGAAVAHEASEGVRGTEATVQELAEAAARISEVVQLISGIAAQTNLLALNETIEAARAGEAGKGFAVVASEVKILAAQTAQATKDISGQIAAIQERTDQTVEAIGGIARTIALIDGSTSAVAAAAQQQAAATQEIGRAVAEAANGTRDAAHHAAGVRDGAERTGLSASAVRDASSDLARRAQAMRGKVGEFLEGLRAA